MRQGRQPAFKTVLPQQATAGRLLTQTENPSWLYPVTMGATTIWERWDSMLEDGTINPGEMTSFNHYALGAVADWLHRVVAGLAPAEPGYRVIRIAPRPLDELDHAAARLETPYGLARSAWRRDGSSVVVEAEIPANTTAEVHLPGDGAPITVGSGTHSWTVSVGRRERRAAPVDESTPLASVIDDQEAYEAIWRALDADDPDAARFFRTSTRWTAGQKLGGALRHVPPAARERIDAALAGINAGR